MLDRGKVFKVEGNLAGVEFAASSECACCGACSLAASGKMSTEVENLIGARVGDEVEVEISPATKVLFPLLVFGIPLLFLVLGLVLGSFISETMGIIFGVVFLALGFLFLGLVDRYVAKQKKFRSRIVKILEKGGA